jgi:Flp pilus assembly protein TadG
VIAGESDAGQATVEAALLLPFVFALLLVVAQVGLLVRAQILVTHAAREGARAAAVDAGADAAHDAATGATTLNPARMQVAVDGRGDTGSHVHVRVTYRAPTDVPIVGPLLGEIDLEADATMRVE